MIGSEHRRFRDCLAMGGAFWLVAAYLAGPCLGQQDRQKAADHSIFLSAQASDLGADSPAVTLNWDRNYWKFSTTDPALIYRVEALNGTSDWGDPIATTTNQFFMDTNVGVGDRYLYRVDVPRRADQGGGYTTQYVTGGIATPFVEDRGVMLLVVDDVTAPQVTPELNRFRKDLIGDGWQVQQILVSPNESPESVKGKIAAAYHADPTRVKSATLLGNVPVAKSGSVVPDGHGRRPFPTDSYYADLDGSWTDVQSKSNNPAGDGQFDQDRVPSSLELQVGRIMFSDMTFFDESEIELTKRYLDKNHAYRHGQFEFNNGVFLGPDLRGKDGFGASGPLFGTDYEPYVLTSTEGMFKTPAYWDAQENQAYWITTWNRGGGTYTSSQGVGSVSDFAASEGMNSAIHSAFASYYGEWDVPNAFLRGLLAAKGQTVATFYAYTPDWALYPLGYGETMGHVARISIEMEGIHLKDTSFNFRDSVIPSLLGDPSIRLFPVTPPTSVESIEDNGAVTISWTPSEDEDIVGYLVYRADSWDGLFERVSEQLIEGTSFVDLNPLENNIYMVRAIKFEVTGSGSYFNPSQGVFTEIALIPEPAIASLALLGGVWLASRRRR